MMGGDRVRSEKGNRFGRQETGTTVNTRGYEGTTVANCRCGRIATGLEQIQLSTAVGVRAGGRLLPIDVQLGGICGHVASQSGKKPAGTRQGGNRARRRPRQRERRRRQQ